MNPTSPPNRAHLSTEQRNAASTAIDAQSVQQTLHVINAQDMLVPRVVNHAIPAITRLVEHLAAAMNRGGRLIYIGAGTSGRLGVLDASECPPTFQTDPEQIVGLIAGGDTALRKSSEGKEDDPAGSHDELKQLALTPDDVLVGIAAGGTTPYVWGALALAKQHGCATGLITCVSMADIQGQDRQLVDFPIELPVGPEVVTGSTRMKAGTATKLALNMITTATMVQRGKTWGNLMVDLRATNAKLRDRALRILTWQTDLDRDAAAALLDRAHGQVKLALVMARLNLPAADAQQRLDHAGGKLRILLGPPR